MSSLLERKVHRIYEEEQKEGSLTICSNFQVLIISHQNERSFQKLVYLDTGSGVGGLMAVRRVG